MHSLIRIPVLPIPFLSYQYHSCPTNSILVLPIPFLSFQFHSCPINFKPLLLILIPPINRNPVVPISLYFNPNPVLPIQILSIPILSFQPQTFFVINWLNTEKYFYRRYFLILILPTQGLWNAELIQNFLANFIFYLIS